MLGSPTEQVPLVQLMPPAELVTVPCPGPAMVTLRTWPAWKVAVTEAFAFMVTAQAPLPLQAPPQPPKMVSLPVDSLSATWVPVVNPWLQLPEVQLMPCGLLVMVPLTAPPVPDTVTVSV